jgi:CheY-like chemotaxis protein
VPDVLVVEDKESLRGMLRKTLEARGLTVVEACSLVALGYGDPLQQVR